MWFGATSFLIIEFDFGHSILWINWFSGLHLLISLVLPSSLRTASANSKAPPPPFPPVMDEAFEPNFLSQPMNRLGFGIYCYFPI